MGLGLLSIYLNLKWKQNDFLKHILIIYEMVKCKLPGDLVTQTARTARTFFLGAPKTHFDPGKTLTNSCLLLTKLLADGFVTHSSLVQVYNLISDVLGQLLVQLFANGSNTKQLSIALGLGLHARYPLVQVYNLISDVFGQLFGLAHGSEVEGVKYDSLDRFLLYTLRSGVPC